MATKKPLGLYSGNIKEFSTSDTVGEAHGGTNQSSYITGDLLYASGSNTLSKLGIGTGSYVLTVVSGIPSWQPASGGSLIISTGLTNSSGTVTSNIITGISGGQIAIGGTAPSENLTLQSTTDSTRGLINFGSAGTSFFSEVNNYLKIVTNTASNFLGANRTDGINIVNTTAATNSVAQNSPTLYFEGNGWNGASSIPVRFAAHVVVTDSTLWKFNLLSQTGSGGYSSRFNLDNAGKITTSIWNGVTIGAPFGGTGVSNTIGVLTWGGNITFSGAFDFTGTLTGTTAVTFPTSGTLITNAVTSLPSLVTIGTITSGGLSTGAVIGGVTMTLGSDATNDTYYRNGSGILARIANGTTGQVFTATTGSAPSWQAASAGGGSIGLTIMISRTNYNL